MGKFEEGLENSSARDGKSQDPSITMQKATNQISKMWYDPGLKACFDKLLRFGGCLYGS